MHPHGIHHPVRARVTLPMQRGWIGSGNDNWEELGLLGSMQGKNEHGVVRRCRQNASMTAKRRTTRGEGRCCCRGPTTCGLLRIDEQV